MSRFQTFDDATHPSRGTERIGKLRAELARRGLGGFIVPRADEHQGEYVPPNAERLAWLTGFTGSAGAAVILGQTGAIVVDGRYTLQAAAEVDTALLTPVPSAETSLERWIAANLPAGAALGYDPTLHTVEGVRKLEKAAGEAGGRLEPVEINLVDVIWADRPPRPCAPVRPHPIERAGEESASKLARACAKLAEAKLDALLVSDPHNLAWIFNLRGGDVGHTPIALGYALIPREGRPTLFLDPGKMTNEAGAAVGDLTDVAPSEALPSALEALGRAGAKVRVDAATGSAALARRIEVAGGTADAGPDPITAMKAVKNAAEMEGARASHRRDGAAVARLLAWLAAQAPEGQLTEIDVAERLEAFRIDTGALEEVSFPTIAGSGPNGAIVHYRPTRRSNRRIGPGELLLVDSGGQYRDGTTDITRTVAVGAPTPEMRDRFTRVLRGHIAIARAVFPKGATGAQLDTLARLPLWEAGLDFDHGTGHGVGSFLSVHEGPQRISKIGHAALEIGMIVSNEPGFYKPGHYGIRIENLVLVEARCIEGATREMRGFETLTLAPIDRALIEPGLMHPEEVAWLDAYHERVREELTPLMEEGTRSWLEEATRPLAVPFSPQAGRGLG